MAAFYFFALAALAFFLALCFFAAAAYLALVVRLPLGDMLHVVAVLVLVPEVATVCVCARTIELHSVASHISLVRMRAPRLARRGYGVCVCVRVTVLIVVYW